MSGPGGGREYLFYILLAEKCGNWRRRLGEGEGNGQQKCPNGVSSPAANSLEQMSSSQQQLSTSFPVPGRSIKWMSVPFYNNPFLPKPL
jgi:hypothetical protein